MNALVPSASLPPIVSAAGVGAQTRFWEFFAANIRNPNTRRAYARRRGNFWPGARAPASRRSPTCSRCTSRAYIEQLGTRAIRADRQAAPRRDPASVRLAGDGPGDAGQSGRFGARAGA